jgi:hypothetical protein
MSALQGKPGEGTIGWMARNSIAANLAMVILLAGGFFFAATMQKEVFPEFELDIVTVHVGYPGAAHFIGPRGKGLRNRRTGQRGRPDEGFSGYRSGGEPDPHLPG